MVAPLAAPADPKAMSPQKLSAKVSERLGYISMMEGCGFVKGSTRHTAMVQETVTGIGNLIKCVKEIEPATF